MTVVDRTPPTSQAAATNPPAGAVSKPSRVERPILAREADSTYWMSRYVERTENVARLLMASSECMIDLRDVAPAMLDRQWRSVLRIMHVEDPPTVEATDLTFAERVTFHMTLADDNPSSLISCLTRARENARGIREGISTDMWEHLNRLYWTIQSSDCHDRFIESPEELYKECIAGAMSFQGLTDETLPHDQRWNFAQLGKFFERIAFTCRVLSENSGILLDTPAESPLRNIHWTTVLRCCNSNEANRRANPGELEGETVAEFLLLEPGFPRSVRHCVGRAKAAIAAICAEVRPKMADPAERILGKLQAQLDYADSAELLGGGLAANLEFIQQQTAQAALAVQKAYFLH